MFLHWAGSVLYPLRPLSSATAPAGVLVNGFFGVQSDKDQPMILSRLAKLRARQTHGAASKKASRPRLGIESLEDRRLLAGSPLSYDSTGGAVTIDISSDHLSYEIRNSAQTVVAQQLVADTSEIDIQGSLSQSNTLILNFANATTQPSAVSYTAQGTTQGSIYIDNGNNPSLTINYGLFTSNADSIIDEIATAVRDFSFTDNGINPETITLAAGSTSGTMTLQSNNALPVTFLDPSSSLSVDEDGILADTVAIGSVDPSFSGQLTVIGGDETVDVEPSVFNGPLIVNAGGGTNSTVNIEPSTLSVAGKAAFLATSVAVDSTSITSTGDQVYGGAVTLDTSPITISSTGGNVTFNGTVDGASNLTVNAAAATFYDPVGSLSELKSLTLNAGTVNVDSTVSTTGRRRLRIPRPAACRDTCTSTPTTTAPSTRARRRCPASASP